MVMRNELSQMKAKALPAGKHADGQGLWLCKRSKDTGKWMLRVTLSGKRREMGLGRWPDVSIAEAREKATQARKLVRDGLDPITERQKYRKGFHRLTLGDAIDGCFRSRQAELKGDGKAGQWMSPLKVHVIPKIGQLPAVDVDQHVIMRVIQPIWHTKPVSAKRP